MMTDLRTILKIYPVNSLINATHSKVIRDVISESAGLSDRVKAISELGPKVSRFTVRLLSGKHKVKVIHMIYSSQDLPDELNPDGCKASKSVPLTLGKLEAKAKSTRKQKANKSSDNRNQVLITCRELIADQISDFRDNFWSEHFRKVKEASENDLPIPPYPKCRLTGRSLWSNKCHVDHRLPFIILVTEWSKLHGINLDTESTVNSRKLKCRVFRDEVLNYSWIDYHRRNARLELILASANLRKGAKVVTED